MLKQITSHNMNFVDEVTEHSSGGDTKLKYYNHNTLKNIPQIKRIFSEKEIFDMEVVASVLPFKVNNYVINELINWDNPVDDSIFRLTFPQKEMLQNHHFELMADLLKKDANKQEIMVQANKIRIELNPHPAGQTNHNVPIFNGVQLNGMQHKYEQTVLFFPAQGQTCHSYCTFCFRWPQFVNMDDLKFATLDIDNILEYIRAHQEVTDILFTGGDPMVMNPKLIANYIGKIVDAKIPHLRNIRIGTKSLSYYPYLYLNKPGGDIIINSFKKAIKSGLHISMMAHFNHYQELKTDAVKLAIEKILESGVRIRTQSPVFNHINNSAEVWAKMLNLQVNLGCVPYYMFIARDTGAQHYFKIPLVEAWNIFRTAYSKLSGLARTVRGPSMSCGPGKIQVLGVSEFNNEKVFVLRFLQGRKSDWVHRPFFAKYDEKAYWISDLKPAFNEDKFFYEDELQSIYKNMSMTDDVEMD